MKPKGPVCVLRSARVVISALVLSVLMGRGLAAQICLGGTPESRGWAAVALGGASGRATLIGADLGLQISRSFAVFGDGDATAYPSPDPRRDRLALGGAYTFVRSEHIGICLTPGIEVEQIGDLRVVRIPVGVSLGWTATSSNGRGRIGVKVEPFVVYSRESIERFSYNPRFVSGRAAIVLGYRRLLLGLEHENAFDRDARSHTRVRFGIVFE